MRTEDRGPIRTENGLREMEQEPNTTRTTTQSSVLSPQSSVLSPHSSILSPHSFLIASALAGVLIAAAFCGVGRYREAAGAALLILVSGCVAFGGLSISSLLVAWFVGSPIASFFIRYPYDKSLVTFNRLILVLAAWLLFIRIGTSRNGSAVQNGSEERTSVVPRFKATPFEIAWAALSVIALISALLKSHDPGYAGKIAFDSFCLPLLAFRIARSHFIIGSHSRWLTLAGIALALLLFAAGAYELATGFDLFAYKGSELIRAGERRVNGPFSADSSYAVICLMLFLFLRAAPQALSVRFDKTSRLVYEGALGAAMIASMLPMFRTVGIALVACWAILELASGRRPALEARSLVAGRWHIAVLVAVVSLGAAVTPALFARRLADPSNAFSRVATWEAAAEIAAEHPLFGVGLANYGDFFLAKYKWEDESVEQVMNTSAIPSPHSNLLWIAAELGWLAFAVYVVANISLALMGWRTLRRERNRPRRTAAACFVALVVAYWITGLTLTSGVYSDLNLYFLFLAGVLSKRFEKSAEANRDGMGENARWQRRQSLNAD